MSSGARANGRRIARCGLVVAFGGLLAACSGSSDEGTSSSSSASSSSSSSSSSGGAAGEPDRLPDAPVLLDPCEPTGQRRCSATGSIASCEISEGAYKWVFVDTCSDTEPCHDADRDGQAIDARCACVRGWRSACEGTGGYSECYEPYADGSGRRLREVDCREVCEPLGVEVGAAPECLENMGCVESATGASCGCSGPDWTWNLLSEMGGCVTGSCAYYQATAEEPTVYPPDPFESGCGSPGLTCCAVTDALGLCQGC